MQAARLASGRKTDWFARMLDISHMHFRKQLTGRVSVSTDRISLFAKLAGVPPAWILNGEGPIPKKVAKRLEDARYIDFAGVKHDRPPITELMFVMGPFLSKEAKARDKTDILDNANWLGWPKATRG